MDGSQLEGHWSRRNKSWANRSWATSARSWLPLWPPVHVCINPPPGPSHCAFETEGKTDTVSSQLAVMLQMLIGCPLLWFFL